MGFYPLQMGEGHYAVGSPLFTKMTVHLDNGKTLTINAPNNSAKNIYVTGLSVNWWRATRRGSTATIANGGTVTFTMGSAPTSWGTAQQLPSITTGDQPPTPLDDLTGPDRGRRRCRLGGRTDRQHVAHRDHAAHGSGGHVPVRRTEERGPAVHADLGPAAAPHRLAARGVQRRHDLEGGRRPQQRDLRPAAADPPVQGQEPRSVPVLPADRHRRRRQRLARRAGAHRAARSRADRPGVRRLVRGGSRPGRHRGHGEPVAADRRRTTTVALEELRHLVADRRRSAGPAPGRRAAACHGRSPSRSRGGRRRPLGPSTSRSRPGPLRT